ncbi:MAG: alpha-L-fucosidase [Spirochaetales bacterium]|jgi:alpha-L-fucosidase|nr:alpha-L-fucosidase [Spirochaetales bacterium]
MSTITEAAGITPHPRQISWQETEFYGFIHFSPNTFTNREWGEGTEDPQIFDPTNLDTDQWAAVARSAGMRGLIITAKHHDGFCLWPSKYTEHSVKNSSFAGDVVGLAAESCRRAGLKFGIYNSPWDRHEPSYGDSPKYNEHFRNQLRELCSNYGELFTLWFDGACGEGPNGKRQVYDWNSYYEVIRELQPNACISICGPDTRWCGNEAGVCRNSEWSVVPAELQDQEKIADASQKEDDSTFRLKITSTDSDLGSRSKISQAAKLVWYPAEVDTSIRPGWFYHQSEDNQVRALEELLNIYYGSVGGNATLLLNFPPDRRGLIHENDAARAKELGDVLRKTFDMNLTEGGTVTVGPGTSEILHHEADRCIDGTPGTYWTAADGDETAELLFHLTAPSTFDTVLLQEYIRDGQRIEGFRLEIVDGDGWRCITEGSVVGYKRLLRFPAVTASKIRLLIAASRIRPTLSQFGLYLSPQDSL